MTEKVMSRARAEQALWAGLRLVVIDFETTNSKDTGTRAVSLGLVTCRAGKVMGRWGTHVNPGVHITPSSTRIHGLRDEDVADAPSFADIAPTVLGALTAAPGEVLVVVAHNVAFDVSVLRSELERAGAEVPELPVLDTMGKLPALAQVKPSGLSLAALVAELGLTNATPHDALSDAIATAQAAVELLGRAAEAGLRDITALLAQAEATTTRTQRAAKAGSGDDDEAAAAPVLSAEHVASHSSVLTATPAPRTLTRWRRSLSECGALRCSHTADRLDQAAASTHITTPVWLEALTAAVDAGDAPAAATLLWGASWLLDRYADDLDVRNRRPAASELYDRIAALVADLPRCEDDQCPPCRDGDPCGIDTWTYHLAGAALGRFALTTVKSFLPYSGERHRAGTSVWQGMVGAGRAPLADAVLWRCHEWFIDTHNPSSAALLDAAGWDAGSRHPRIALAHMDSVSSGGREADLHAAIAIADEALAVEPKIGPPEHWRTLLARRTQLAGQLARGQRRRTGRLDKHGNEIVTRWHHPVEPKRVRQPRFLRRLPGGPTAAAPDLTGLSGPDTVEDERATVARTTSSTSTRGKR